MKRIVIIGIALFLFLISPIILPEWGRLLGNRTPGCGDERALNLVKEIAHEELGERYDIEETSLTLIYVITTAYDKEIDVHSCSATVEAKYEEVEYNFLGGSNRSVTKDLSRNITFDVYTLGTDKTVFLVGNVSGLDSFFDD